MALFDPETGEVLDDGDECERCKESRAAERAEMLALLNQAEADLRAAERDLRRERRVSAALRMELQTQIDSHPKRQVAEALFRYWLAALKNTGHEKKGAVFGEKRRKAVLARLADHDPVYIARAIDGFVTSIYTAPNGKRFDDIELLCRDETKLEASYDMAERIKAPTMIGAAWCREFGSDMPEEFGEPSLF